LAEGEGGGSCGGGAEGSSSAAVETICLSGRN
jgi:hypothetical protein